MAPVLHTTCPFASDIHRRWVEHFQQRFVVWENALSFGDLAKLTMVALNHVRCVDQLTDLRRVFEEGGKLLPIVAPGSDNERVLAVSIDWTHRIERITGVE